MLVSCAIRSDWDGEGKIKEQGMEAQYDTRVHATIPPYGGKSSTLPFPSFLPSFQHYSKMANDQDVLTTVSPDPQLYVCLPGFLRALRKAYEV